MCLNAEEVRALKVRLEELKASIQSEGYASLSPNRTDDAGRRDDDFQPLNEMNQVLQSSKNRNKKEVLSLIAVALARFDDEPEFVGRCDECEQCIGKARLGIFPYALHCVRCQESLEAQDSFRSGRRHLTDFKR